MDDKEEFSFMEENVMESKRPQRRFLSGIKKSICFGVAFGVAAGVGFSLTSMISQHFNNKQEVIALKTSASPEDKDNVTTTPLISKKPKKEESEKNASSISAEEMQKFYQNLGKQAKEYNDSVVGISTYNEKNGMEELPGREEQISAVVVARTKEYLMLLTSYNAINDGNSLQVTFYDGVTAKASLYNADQRLNLAIVKVALSELPTSTKDCVKVVALNENDRLEVGDILLALGSPNGTMYSMEFGVVTAESVTKNVEDYQLDVYTTNMGYHSSGYGIVCNIRGEVVGLLNSQGMDSEVSSFYGISKLKLILENLLNKKTQVFAGVVAKEMPSSMISRYNLHGGIYVTDIEEASPAFHGGILAGDVIEKIGEETVEDVVSFFKILQKYKPGDNVEITLIRNPFGEKQEKKVHVKIGKR